MNVLCVSLVGVGDTWYRDPFLRAAERGPTTPLRPGHIGQLGNNLETNGQGSEKWGRWGRIFPDKAKSHGQFGPKTTYKTERQTDSRIQTDRQSEDRQKSTWTDS